jgi:sugar-specific transcriptional regulator TrmB
MISIERLQELGLTANESKVYKALLELGPSLAGGISRRAGLHRRTVYDTTEMLIKKGLIGYILKNNRRLFQASNPEKFLDILKEKENSVSEILPEMLNFFQQTKEKDETNFYKGNQGLKTVFEEQLREVAKNKEILILGANKSAFDILPFYFKWYDKDRLKKRIKVRIIASEKIGKIPLSEIRYLPSKYANPLAINIYGNKTALILWKKDNPLAIVIKDDAISSGYRKYFELTWKQARKS